MTTPRQQVEPPAIVDPGIDVEIGTVDGVTLVGRSWPVARPRGIVVIAHGLGEHGGAYAHVANALRAEAGVDILATDFRGHGRSPGRRGVVRRYEDLGLDLVAAIAHARHERPGLPVFALGHSNGGQVVLRTVLDEPTGLAGIILSNPALRVLTPIPRWKLEAGRFLRKFAPGVTLGTAVDHAILTRDLAVIEARRDDSLRHARVNGALFFGLVEGGQRIADRAAEITLPVLLILGGSDSLIDPAFTLAAFRRFGSADATLASYPEMLHEPLNDLDRGAPIAEIGRWLVERIERG